MSVLDDLGSPEFSIIDKRRLNTTPHYVYVARNVHGRALYVGQTRNVPGRMAGHRKLSSWWPQAKQIDFYRCQTRDHSWEIETALISELRPYYNRSGGNYRYLRAIGSSVFCGSDEDSAEGDAA